MNKILTCVITTSFLTVLCYAFIGTDECNAADSLTNCTFNTIAVVDDGLSIWIDGYVWGVPFGGLVNVKLENTHPNYKVLAASILSARMANIQGVAFLVHTYQVDNRIIEFHIPPQ